MDTYYIIRSIREPYRYFKSPGRGTTAELDEACHYDKERAEATLSDESIVLNAFEIIAIAEITSFELVEDRPETMERRLDPDL